MRLTTKIILGIILFVFVASLAFIVGFSFTERTKKCQNKYFALNPKDTTVMQLSPYKVICFDYGKREVADKKLSVRVRPLGGIKICPLTDPSQANQLSFPKEATAFFSAIVKNDTLFVTLDQTQMAEFLKNKGCQGKSTWLSDVDFTIYTNSVDVKNSISTMSANIAGIHTDVIKLNVKGKAYIDSCAVEKIIVNRGDLILKNSETKQLNIDLDKVQNWTVKNCRIDEENLTGGKNRRVYSVYQPKKEAKVVNWCPKDKKAKLNIELSGDSAQVVFK